MVAELGPQLFDADARRRGAARAGDRPRSRAISPQRRVVARRPRAAHEEIADDIARLRPARAAARRRLGHRDHGQRAERVWIERQGRLFDTPVRFNDDAHLRRIINKIVGRSAAASTSPRRWSTPGCPTAPRQRDHPPLSLSGPLVTIRKFSKRGSPRRHGAPGTLSRRRPSSSSAASKRSSTS